MQTPNYIEFSDPRLSSLYDILNPFSDDTKFYIEFTEKYPKSTIIDIGCGTGLLTCELAKLGHKMIGVEPEKSMLEIARHKQYGSEVQWIEGDASKLGSLNADLVIMSGHVAQVFIDDKDWKETLSAAYKALRAGGTLVFDSRNPLLKPWTGWTPENSMREVVHPELGNVTVWSKFLDMTDNRVQYEMHYVFETTGEDLVSVNNLVFRSKEQITESLRDIGFSVEHMYGDWNSNIFEESSREMIFIATKI